MTEARIWRRGPQLSAPQWQRVLTLLLVVQFMLMPPVLMMLPAWLVLIPVVTGSWQWQVLRGRWRPPGRAVRWSLVLALPLLLVLGGMHPGALDFYVALAFIGVALKLFEMRTYRDAWLVSLMAFFVFATLLLLDQGIFYSLYVFLGVSFCLAALARLHAPRGISLLGAWRTSARAVLIAVPFMLLLFVAFPRLPPIWQMPMASEQARTGLSDTLSTGGIAQLAQSNELIFRARFDGAAPPQSELYWRAMTLNHFDGTRWTQWSGSGPTADLLQGEPPAPAAAAEQWSYEMILAPTAQPWVATLEHLTTYQAADARWAVDNRLVWRENLRRPTGLTARSARTVAQADELPTGVRQAALQMPSAGNPQLRSQAADWYAEADSDLAMAERIMDFFADEDFRYTLQPGTYGGADGIDEFLFDRRLGFCAHYAEAMVLMLRSVDIPARLVTGYMGGQWREDGSYVVVRAREAHAWVETWIEGQGWVRFDPTGVVAPDRLTGSLSDALTDDDQATASDNWGDTTAPGWLQRLYWQWDSAQYGWQRWVLNFDADDQSSLLEDWFGDPAPGVWLSWIGGGLIFIFVTWYGVQYLTGRARLWGASRLEMLGRRHCRRQWPELPPNEGLTQWARRLHNRSPEFADQLSAFAEAVLAARYGPPAGQKQQRRLARQRLQTLRRLRAPRARETDEHRQQEDQGTATALQSSRDQ
ncbi:transglutaminase TgpA family protein [Natronospirillum operosum]|nr:DUF3488 and transglutaminase-like domain-containing protein [Natronospirillum operosum]